LLTDGSWLLIRPSGTEPKLRIYAEAASDETDTDEAAGGMESPDDADLEWIDGIGATYAERLRGAGVDSLRALAAADAEDLAEDIDVAPNRVANWIEQAERRTS
jgi:polyhydroxyalkanoate synthase